MTPRWRLFPKYALLIIALVGGLLIASGATSIYFSWRETERNLIDLQAEKAQAAAARIEQYILDIEHQLGWTTLPALDEGSDPFEPRRTEYQKLFRLVPAITEVAWIDPNGREQVRISRVAVNVDGSNDDYSQAAKFKVAKGGTTYYGPVYFRKETEPYMTIARPAGLGGGVTAAEVNLKFVWEVVSRIRIGEKGLAWVVDDGGVLIAHPDISLVLRKTDLSALPQVAALKQAGAAAKKTAQGIDGAPVLSAHAAIPTLNWTVFVESPETEAFAPLYASILRAGLLLGAGLLVSMVASFFVARALVRPLQALQEGAARVGAGELDRRIEIRTGDELEGLAEQFNHMSAQLRESYAGLERKVEQRTVELTESLKQQTATSEVLKLISRSTFDLDVVLNALLESAARLCNAEGGVLYRSDASGNYLPLVVFLLHGDEAARERYRKYLQSHPIRVDDGSAAGRAVLLRKPVHIEDVKSDPNYRRLDLTEQADFRNVLAVPLLRDGEPIGAIALSNTAGGAAFTTSQIELVTTFADQAAIAIENARLFHETKEALDRQTATAEILRVISSSPSDVQPVFDAIAKRARLLCAADSSAVRLPDGEVLRVRARDLSEQALAVRTGSRDTVPIRRTSLTGRAFLEARSIHVEDVQLEVDTEYPDVSAIVKRNNFRTVLVVPMLRDGRAIGTISLFRYTVRPFSSTEIDLVKTFADQAVIAIENVRLFNETKEALQQQTATAEVLKVISSSVSDAAPVFETILDSCQRLFASSEQGVLLEGEDGRLHLGAHHGRAQELLQKMFPVSRDVAGTSPDDARRMMHFKDVLNDADVPAGLRAIAERIGVGSYSQVIAPMMWEGESIGSLYVIRQPPVGFSDKEIGLLRTFADQAVIAIQNARLFNETKEALEQQRASADVLTAISNSISDAKPVFEVIIQSCQRLFEGHTVGVTLLRDDGLLDVDANVGPGFEALKRGYPRPLDRSTASGLAILERRVVAFEDIDGVDVPSGSQEGARAMGNSSMAVAPMLFRGDGIGTLWVGRATKGPFSEKEVELLRTFADQAVIAIQNARLFNETKEALEQQTATAEVLQVISSSVADTQPVFDKILDSCERLFAASGLGIYLVGDDGLLRKAGFRGTREQPERALAGTFPRPLEGTATEQAIRERRVVHFADVLADPGAPEPLRRVARAAGSFSVAFAPMLWEGRGVGAVQVSRDPPEPFSEKELTLLKTFADQAVIAIQNARLFNEIQSKSRELEMANKHKSEFLANMSHELRTPLNAIIGFSEVLSEKMFGEVNDKQLEYLLDIHTSGHHLLSLINDILDLSKIEAGRMELDLAATSLPMLLDNCTTLVRERASRNGLVLALEVEEGLGDWVADVRKLKQIVINLLSNAVKFTPAGGCVTLRARRLERAVEIAVIDTGVGIAKDQQALVFEEFRQAGGDYLRKAEGTGLGLSLARRFVELHGGTMRVESEPGRGSTFSFVLPERVLEAAA